MKATSQIVLAAVALATWLGACGCASIVAEAPIGDGYRIAIYSSGSKAHAEMKPLTKNEVEMLTGSKLGAQVPTEKVYYVVIVTGDSSGFTRAVSAFLGERESLTKEKKGIADAGGGSKGGSE